MSLFLQYHLAQSLGDLGAGGGGWTAGGGVGAGLGLGMGLVMPGLIWRQMAPRGFGPGGHAHPVPGPLPPPASLRPRFCGHCGAPFVYAARFCGHCGTAAAR